MLRAINRRQQHRHSSDTSLIQTIGRAARNAEGLVIMYADRITDSMHRAIDETQRRRAVQEEYNRAHNITPRTIKKKIKDLIETTLVAEAGGAYGVRSKKRLNMSAAEQEELIATLTREMREASHKLDFERAASLRDMIVELKGSLPAKAVSKRKRKEK